VLADNGTWWSVTIDAPDPIREYIYLGGTLLASLTLTTGTPVLTYYHTDVLGSVRAITDAAGATVTRHDYFAFGESASPMTGDPRRFLGQELDAETGFDHLGAREYRNVWGRFASVDPVLSPAAVLDPQQFGRYAYGRNSPLVYVDSDGRDIRRVTVEITGPNHVPDARIQGLNGGRTARLGPLEGADGAYVALNARVEFDSNDDPRTLGMPRRTAFVRGDPRGLQSGRGEDPSRDEVVSDPANHYQYVFDAPGASPDGMPRAGMNGMFDGVFSITYANGWKVFYRVKFNVIAGEVVSQSIQGFQISEAEYNKVVGGGK
jgi:RHS repeat-associated protein